MNNKLNLQQQFHHNQRHIQQPKKGEVIVDKLHSALATLRRERDELHRSKELAIERVKLAKEERSNTEKTVNSLQNHLDTLISSLPGTGSNSVEIEITILKNEVERLTQEAKSQHFEFIDKKENLSKTKSQTATEELTRKGYLRLACDNVRKRREKNTLNNFKIFKDSINEDYLVEMMNKSLSQNMRDKFISKLSRSLKETNTNINTEIFETQKSNEILRRRITGYRHFKMKTDQ